MLGFDQDLSLWFDEAKRDGNPYLTEWLAVMAMDQARHTLWKTDIASWRQSLNQAIRDGTDEFTCRDRLVHQYAWAIPCAAALDALAAHAPILEIGAGTGYWAWLLRQRGVDVLAYDQAPPGLGQKNNHWHRENPCWVDVPVGGWEMATSSPVRSLFLCWPPYADPMALNCLNHYQGRTLLLIGEASGGCTASAEFWEQLETGWHETETVDLPQWSGIHDYLGVWQRK